jgi:hypothetical protein
MKNVRRLVTAATVATLATGGLVLSAGTASAASTGLHLVGPFNNEWECKAVLIWDDYGDFCRQEVDGKWYYMTS